jgi:glycosyltransferase involved in cell wall biosynthesis
LIVIATNNGINYLPRLLTSLHFFGTEGHKVCIVDTGSTSDQFKQYLNDLDPDKYIISYIPKGYDTGAYIHAYFNYPDEEYIFMHDSMEVLTSNWISDFKEENKDAVYYSWFFMAFDTPEQLEHLQEIGIHNPITTHCAFGPIFYIKRTTLDKIHEKFDLNKVIPTNKIDQQGMERGWPMMIESVTDSRSWLSKVEILVEENILYRNLKKYRPTRL